MGISAMITSGGRSLMTHAEAFCEDDNGATSIEYGLIVSLIFLAIVAAVRAVADSTSAMYNEIDTTLTDAVN